MVETNAILNLEMKGQSKVLDALESISENFDTLGKNTKESVTQFGELSETLKDQPKQFNVVAKATDSFAGALSKTGRVSRTFGSTFNRTTSNLEKAASVSEALDNNFVGLGSRILGVNKEFNLFKDVLGSTVEPYQQINSGSTALSKSMRAVTVFGDPARQTIDVIATSSDEAAGSLARMGATGEKAASVLQLFSGNLNKVSGTIGKAQLASQIFQLNEGLQEFIKGTPEMIEQLQEVYEKAEQFGITNKLFGSQVKTITTLSHAYQILNNTTTQVKNTFGISSDPNGLLNLATKTWLQLMAYNETVKVFRVLTKAMYDTALQLQGISSGFGTITAMGIDTQFAEMAVQIGTMGVALIANGEAAEKFAQKAVATFAQFEDKLSEIMVLADGAALGFDNLATNLSKIANNLNNTITTLELAGAQYTAISAGFTDPAFLEAVSKFSKAMSVDITTSAETAARMLKIFRLEARDTAAVLAQAKTVLDKGILTGSDYASVMGQVANVAKSSGLSLEQTNVMLQRLTTLGFSAADAGQGIMSLLSSIAGQGAESANAVKALGINFNELRIRSDGLVAPLNELVDATGGSMARMKEIVPDALALRTAMALATIDTNEYNAAVAEMGRTGPDALDEAFGTRTQSLIERSTALMNGFREEIQTLGMRLSESKFIDGPLKFFEDFLEKFKEAPEPLKNIVVALIGAQIVITRTTSAFDNLTKILFNLAKAYVLSRAMMILFNKTLMAQTIAAIQNARAGTISWGTAINNILGLQKTQLQMTGVLGNAQKGLAAINGFFTKTLFGQAAATQTQTAAITQLTLAEKLNAALFRIRLTQAKIYFGISTKLTQIKQLNTAATIKNTIVEKINDALFKIRITQARIYFEITTKQYLNTLKNTLATAKQTATLKTQEIVTKSQIILQRLWNNLLKIFNKQTWLNIIAQQKQAAIAWQQAKATAAQTATTNAQTKSIHKLTLSQKLNDVLFKARITQAKLYFEVINSEYFLTLKRTLATAKNTIAQKAQSIANTTTAITQQAYNTALIVTNKTTWLTIAAMAKATIAQKANATATQLNTLAFKAQLLVAKVYFEVVTSQYYLTLKQTVATVKQTIAQKLNTSVQKLNTISTNALNASKTIFNKTTLLQIANTIKLITSFKINSAITNLQTLATNSLNMAKAIFNKNTYAQIGANFKLTAAFASNLIVTKAKTIATNLMTAATKIQTASLSLLNKETLLQNVNNLKTITTNTANLAITKSQTLATNGLVFAKSLLNKNLFTTLAATLKLNLLQLQNVKNTNAAIIATKLWGTTTGVVTTATTVLTGVVKKLWAAFGPIAVVVGAAVVAFSTLQDIIGTFVPAIGGVAAENRKTADAIMKVSYSMSSLKKETAETQQQFEHYSGFLNTKVIPTLQFLTKWNPVVAVSRLGSELVDRMFGTSIRKDADAKIDGFFTGLKDNIQAYINGPLYEAFNVASKAIGEEFDRTIKIDSVIKSGEVYSAVAKEIMTANEGRALSAKELESVLAEEEKAIDTQLKNNDELIKGYEELITEIDDPKIKEAYQREIDLLNQRSSALQRNWEAQKLFLQNSNSIKEAIESNNAALSTDAFLTGLDGKIGALEKSFDKLEGILANVPQEAKQSYLDMEDVLSDSLNLTSSTQRRTAVRLTNLMTEFYANIGQVSKDANFQTLTELNADAERSIEAIKDSVAQGVIDQDLAKTMVQQILDQEVEIDGVKGSPLRNAIIDQAYLALDEIDRGSTERRIAFQQEYIEEYKSLENQKIIASEIVAKRVNEINEKILKDRLQTEQNILNRLGRTQGQNTEAYEKQARVVSGIQRQIAENQRDAIDVQLNYEVVTRQKTIDKISAIEAAGLKTQQAARSEIAELTLQIEQQRWQTQRRLLKEVLDEFGGDSEEYKAKLLEVDAATASVQKSQIEATKAANEKVLQDLQDANALAVANLELAVLAGNESRTKLIEEQAALERQELEIKFNNIQAEIEQVKAKNGDVTKLEAEASRIRISIYQNEISTIERLQDRLIKQNQNRTEAAKQMAQAEANALQLITDQLALQQKLRQEQNASVQAVLSQTESQASSIAGLSSNEAIQAQASEQAAKIRLDSLRQAQDIERENLEIERQQNLLALEREKIQLRISKLENQAAIFAAQAELAKAQAAKVEEEQLQAIQLQIAALHEQSNVLGNQESLLTTRVEQEKQIFNSQKLQLDISQQSAKASAEQETQLAAMRSAHAAISHELQIQKEEAETQLKIQNAIAGFVKSSNDSVAAITQSETLRAKITADNATLEVQNLTKRQSIEKQSLEQDKIRQQLLIEEEKIRTQIAIAQNQQLQTEAEINRIKAESIGDTKTVDALAQQIVNLETQEGLLLTQQQSIEQRAARQNKLNAANEIELQTKQQLEKIEAERAKALADIEVSQSQTRKQLKLQSEQLEQNSKLFEAISNFTQSQSSSIESATSNEAIRAKAAAINANVQLQTLQQRQAFEQKQLEIQQEQNKLSLESERLQTNIAIAQNKQLKAELNLQIAKAGTNAQLKQALQQQLAAVESQSGLLQEQLKSLDEREKRQLRANQVANIELSLKQASEAAQAKINQLTAEAETAQAKITQELELQKQTLEIREKVTSAINDYYQSSVSLVGKITQNEEAAAYLRSASAAQALKSLEERQELEQLNLEIEIRRNEMTVEREAIQTKIAIAQNQQAIAMSAMEAARARSQGDEKSAKNIERAAVALGQQSKLLEEQAVWVEQRAAMMEDQNDASRIALGLQQSSAKAEAEIEVTLAKQDEARTRLTKQIERELELIDGAKGAFQSQLDFITGSLDAASSLTNNEQEQKILARTTAQIKLEALAQQQEMEMRVLELQQQQKMVLLEQEAIRIRVQQAQTVADVAKSQAELEKAKASGESDSMIRALEMQVEAGMVQGTALQMAEQGLSQQRNIQEQLFAFEQDNLSRSQALQTQDARINLANTLPTGMRERARNQIMSEILGPFTGNPINGAGRFDRREAMRRLDARAMSGAFGQFGMPQGFNDPRFAGRAGMTQGLNPQIPQLPNVELTPVSTEDARKNFESQLAEVVVHQPKGEIRHRKQREAKEDEFRNIVVSTLESIANKDFNVSQTNSITNNVTQATPTQDVEKEMLDFTQNLFSKTKSLLS